MTAPRPEPAGAGGSAVPLLVDEAGIAAFRARFLAPSFLLGAVDAAPGRAVLAAVPVGVGKSRAADDLIGAPETRARYDLVVYVAPRWAIIEERERVRAGLCPLSEVLLRPRPRARCGALDGAWQHFERAGNAAYARWRLCGGCPERLGPDPCPWPTRFDPDRWESVSLVFTPEEQLLRNRHFVPFLRMLTGAKRILLILDEAQVSGAPFELAVRPGELAAFRAAVARAHEFEPKFPRPLQATWIASLDTLARAGVEGLADAGWAFPAALNRYALAVQQAGLAGTSGFRYLGYDLALLPESRPDERDRDETGRLRYTVRPRLDADVLILSAHVRPAYVAHRLGLDAVAAPFEGLRVTHSGTRVYNLKSAIGMKRYFRKNAPQILGLAAALVARNLLEGRTTVLVSRKGDKAFCAAALAGLLATLPLPRAVRFIPEDYGTLGAPDPAVVPIIHFGMVGVNDFEHYQSAYAVNSYYVPSHALDASFQGHEPAAYALPLRVRLDGAGDRRVEVADPAHAGAGLERLADVHLRKLEVDPALQALGRVRFFTRPREVLFFQLADLAPEVAAVELRSLAEAHTALGVPRFKDLQVAAGAARVRALLARGRSLAAAAAEVGVHKETARRWLGRENPPDVFLRAFAAAAEAAP